MKWYCRIHKQCRLVLYFCLFGLIFFCNAVAKAETGCVSAIDLNGCEHKLSVHLENKMIYLQDDERGITLYDGTGYDGSTIQNVSELPVYSYKEGTECPSSAASVFANMAAVADYYWNIAGVKGIDGEGKPLNVVLNYSDSSGSKNGAFADSSRDFIGFYANVENTRAIRSLEDAGQEYTHMLIANTMHLTSDTIPWSINEGIAISMGLFIENHVNGKAQGTKWRYHHEDNGAGEQNFQFPELTGNASSVGGANYLDESIEELRQQNRSPWQIYQNAGIIEHFCYLLCENGVFSQDMVARIWCETYSVLKNGRFMPRGNGYGWEEIRYGFETAAKNVGASKEQLITIASAFSSVGIDKASKPEALQYRIVNDKYIEITGITSFFESTDLRIPSTIDGYDVCSIGNQAFFENDQIETLHFPETLLYLGEYAFADCHSLKSVRLPDEICKIPKCAFASCFALESVTMGNQVETLGYACFFGCGNLQTIDFSDSLITIGPAAFYHCEKLTELKLPPNLCFIQESAFSGCASLQSISIPEAVTHIGKQAFSECAALTSIIYRGNVTNIEIPRLITFVSMW